MWIPFFKSDQSSSYNQKNVDTTIFCNHPSLESLENGLLPCRHCGGDIALENSPVLQLAECPYCSEPNFIPYKIGDYWLFEILGSGGMGAVFKGFYIEDPELEVAVKLLPLDRQNDQSLKNTLLSEAQIGYQFGEHPHLTQVYDFGTDENGIIYACYELITGIRLDHIIEGDEPPPLKIVILWILQLLSAEKHIYQCGYLFRDLKPQNIMINPDGNIKLLDYGLCLSLEDASDGGGDEIEGSPIYMPPERIVGTGESQCSEIYSLGMVFFHILAGHPYFNSDEANDLARKHVSSLRVTNLHHKFKGNVDPEVIEVLQRMIQRNPSDRYWSYEDVAKDLFKIYNRMD